MNRKQFLAPNATKTPAASCHFSERVEAVETVELPREAAAAAVPVQAAPPANIKIWESDRTVPFASDG